MSEVVERVALALCGTEVWHGDPEYWRRRARIAIEAMREPTDEMAKAAFRPHGAIHDERWVWRDMIDAALSEAAP